VTDHVRPFALSTVCSANFAIFSAPLQSVLLLFCKLLMMREESRFQQFARSISRNFFSASDRASDQAKGSTRDGRGATSAPILR
jgi:hypothetical protein